MEREVDEELAFHVEMRVRELVAAGWSEESARREAVQRFGDLERVKSECREWGEERDVENERRAYLDEIRQDLAYALRQLRRAPGFALTATLTLALAIGASTSVFSVVDAVLLKPLPYPEPDRLSVMWTKYLPPSGFDIDQFALSGPELLDYAEENRTFEHFGGWFLTSRALTDEAGEPERVPVTKLQYEVHRALGVEPLLGRWFTRDEDVFDPAEPVALIGHGLWTTRYGRDPDILERTILLSGVPTRVLGVMPPGFAFPDDSRAWLPAGLDRSNAGDRGGHGWRALGRRRPGVAQAEVDAELDVLNAAWAEEHPHNVAHFPWSETLREWVVGDSARVLGALSAAVGLVLLIACANIASLLLARSERRRSEIAVRQALGAGRGRLARQLLTESLVIASLGGLGGLALAAVGTPALLALDPGALPRADTVGLDARVLAFTAAATLVTASLFGIGPSLLAGRRGLASVAGTTSRAVGAGHRGLRRAAVAGQVALGLVVVVLAGLVGRSLQGMASTDPGMQPEGVLTFGLSLTEASYPESAATPAAWRELLERLERLPGVERAAAATALPFSGSVNRWDFQLDDRPPRQEGDLAWNALVTTVTPGYFETLGIPRLAGRVFQDSDGPDDAYVGVISRSMAETYWPGESPLGKRWGYAQLDEDGETRVEWISVIGVVADQVSAQVVEDVVPQVYLPSSQVGITGYGWPRTMTVAVRTAGAPTRVLPAVRRAVGELDPDLPLTRVGTLEEAVSASMATPRLTRNLLGSFALLAVVLAAVGLHGLVAYTVAGRTREIGVRRALGASRGRVTRMVVGEGALPLAIGIGVGLVGAWYATRLVASMLYEVDARDPLTFVAVAAAFVGVGLAASFLPARKAASVEPTRALREEGAG